MLLLMARASLLSGYVRLELRVTLKKALSGLRLLILCSDRGRGSLSVLQRWWFIRNKT